MSATIEMGAAQAAGGAKARRGHWIDEWEPEDEAFWEATGRRVARRNLVWSVFAEHLIAALWVFVGAYLVFAATTYIFYLRRSSALRGV